MEREFFGRQPSLVRRCVDLATEILVNRSIETTRADWLTRIQTEICNNWLVEERKEGGNSFQSKQTEIEKIAEKIRKGTKLELRCIKLKVITHECI